MSLMHIHSTQEFEEKVLHNDKLVLVDFWADWCGPCRMLAPILDQAAAQFEGKADIAKINVDELQSLASAYQVMNIPSLFLIQNGKVINQTVGALPLASLTAFINSGLENH